mgnify:CR=1 FL=1
MCSFESTSVNITHHHKDPSSAISKKEMVFPFNNRPTFSKLPKNKKHRKKAKKKRRSILQKWKKLNTWLDYFRQENTTFIQKIDAVLKKMDECYTLFKDYESTREEEAMEERWCRSKNIPFISSLEDSYSIEDVQDDLFYHKSEIEKLFNFHRILSDVAKEKGIHIEALSEDVFYEVDSIFDSLSRCHY